MLFCNTVSHRASRRHDNATAPTSTASATANSSAGVPRLIWALTLRLSHRDHGPAIVLTRILTTRYRVAKFRSLP